MSNRFLEIFNFFCTLLAFLKSRRESRGDSGDLDSDEGGWMMCVSERRRKSDRKKIRQAQVIREISRPASAA